MSQKYIVRTSLLVLLVPLGDVVLQLDVVLVVGVVEDLEEVKMLKILMSLQEN